MNPSRLVIRRAAPPDAPALAALLSHPQVQPGLMQLPYGSEARVRAMLQGNDEPGRVDLSLVAERDGQLLGSAGLHPASTALRRRHVMMLGISVDPSAWGQGIGTALMQALVDYADRWGQVLRIELTVYCDNPRAIALYRRFGFVQEGRHVGYSLRDGAYVDVWSMARLHPNPPRWQPMPPADPAP